MGRSHTPLVFTSITKSSVPLFSGPYVPDAERFRAPSVGATTGPRREWGWASSGSSTSLVSDRFAAHYLAISWGGTKILRFSLGRDDNIVVVYRD